MQYYNVQGTIAGEEPGPACQGKPVRTTVFFVCDATRTTDFPDTIVGVGTATDPCMYEVTVKTARVW